MIAPGPDDRPGKLRWVFGSNRVERSDIRAAFGLAGWSKPRWTKCLRAVRPERGLARNVARRSGRSKCEIPGAFGSEGWSDPRREKCLRTVRLERCKGRNVARRSERSKARNLAPSSDSTGVASRRNQKARPGRKTWRADRSPATGESVATPAPQLRFRSFDAARTRASGVWALLTARASHSQCSPTLPNGSPQSRLGSILPGLSCSPPRVRWRRRGAGRRW